MNELLASPGQFEAIALARPESITKEVYQDLARRGATVKGADFTAREALVPLLVGADVVISCLTIMQKAVDEVLIDAAHAARVGRYVLSFFGTVSPPRGVMALRNEKEDLLDRCKRLYLPYTAMDVGWWFQSVLPDVPSGKLDGAYPFPDNIIYGDGNTKTALTDKDNIGKYVVRVIADPRTLNKLVFAYEALLTQNEIWAAVEKFTNQKIATDYLSKAEVETVILAAKNAIAKDPRDPVPMFVKSITEYKYGMWIRGDNSPEHAEYLGYLFFKDLYPEIEYKPAVDFISEIVTGSRSANFYADRPYMASTYQQLHAFIASVKDGKA
jgi:uncharacterized protein YbjT (DUF2867 family)